MRTIDAVCCCRRVGWLHAGVDLNVLILGAEFGFNNSIARLLLLRRFVGETCEVVASEQIVVVDARHVRHVLVVQASVEAHLGRVEMRVVVVVVIVTARWCCDLVWPRRR